MPRSQVSRYSRRWIAVTAALALVALAFNAPRIVGAVRQLVDPPPSKIIIAVPEGSETI